jgi:UDP-N-acetylmuramate--alanine ligase
MLNPVDFSGRPFHFIGIGGIGMSALAYVLARRQLPVSGSDLRTNHITKHLEELGVHVFQHQEASNLEYFSDVANLVNSATPFSGLPQVVCSTAIRADNSEYQAAKGLGCPILHRSDILAALMGEYQSIAVAGTHGKTTTSSLTGYCLLHAGLDPTIIVGGEVKAWQGNARVGKSPYLVAEADESDGSLTKFSAAIGVITNIELDHPDHYSSLDEVVKIFETFVERSETLVVSWDCPTIRQRLAPSTTKKLISYSLDPALGAEYSADQITYTAQGTRARIWERGQVLGTLDCSLLGQHNLSNALAAIAVCRLLNLDFDAIAEAIASFEGAQRRFELRGEANGIRFIDDYAHHPSEIRATLAAARLQVEDPNTSGVERLVAVFQPHRYSRTHTFLEEFSQGFSDADLVVLTDIYSAGEPDQGLIKGQNLADRMAEYHTHVNYQPTLAETVDFLKQNLRPRDLVMFLGAGNLNQVIPGLCDYFQNLPIQKSAVKSELASMTEVELDEELVEIDLDAETKSVPEAIAR